MPETAILAPKARAAKPAHHAKAKAKVVPKKRLHIRTANTVTPTNPFGTPPTKPYANPFDVQHP
jgi:hypothetical protein